MNTLFHRNRTLPSNPLCRRIACLLLFFLVAASALTSAPPARSQGAPRTDSVAGMGGVIFITPIFHGSLQLEYKGRVIHIDPFSMGDYRRAKKADVVLITHAHPDHLDHPALARVLKAGTVIVAPSLVAEQLGRYNRARIFTLANGQQRKIHNFSVEAVPMYNLKRGPAAGQFYHPKGVGNGYVLLLGGKKIYVAGDTEVTPEMRRLKNIHIAFLPMNLPFTMTAQEAATGVKAFRPRIVYPYHYRYPFNKPNQNAQQFAAALRGSGIQVRLREWYRMKPS